MTLARHESERRGVENLLLYDANSDGLQDLIYTSTLPGPNSRQMERYEVFVQRKDMTFGTEPYQVLDVPYDGNSDVTFRDINSDHRLDAIVVRSNFDLVNPKTLIKIYISNSKAQQVFTRETERYITKDPIGLVRIADFNSDGVVDFATTFFSYQFGSAEDIVDLALENKLTFKLQFFPGLPGKGFDRRPAFEKELTLNMKTETYRGYAPLLIVDDLNNDRIMDLIVRSAEDRLRIYPSQNGLAFAKDPAATVDIPADAAVDIEDVNGDGLSDILVSSVSKQFFTVYVSVLK